jgi:hypothetical protein
MVSSSSVGCPSSTSGRLISFFSSSSSLPSPKRIWCRQRIGNTCIPFFFLGFGVTDIDAAKISLIPLRRTFISVDINRFDEYQRLLVRVNEYSDSPCIKLRPRRSVIFCPILSNCKQHLATNQGSRRMANNLTRGCK